MNPEFVHLRLHSEYSLVDGLVRIKPLIAACQAKQMPAVAMTDQCNLFGLVKFYRAALSAGVKPIVGADFLVRSEEMGDEAFRITLLCKDKTGYLNLKRLISKAYLQGQQRGVPLVDREWLRELSAGLICLSGGRQGDVGKALLADNHQLAAENLGFWQHCFPDSFYLELHRTGRPQEETYLHAVVGLAQGAGVPVVATNDVRFLEAEDFGAHEARVSINQGRALDDPRRPRDYSEQQYLRSAAEMQEIFSDIPEAIENTVEIARRCNLELALGTYFLPDYPVPEGQSMASHLEHVSREGLERRLEFLYDTDAEDFPERRKAYDERLQIELDVINEMGFPGYFLIVADFIRWSKKNGVPVGPGRGSGAGSLVAYALDITDLDPLEYDLLFERFLNPERISMPDFDVDFCMEGRDRVIDYVAETYGRSSVSQIITFGTMAAKAAIRDVGRVLGQPYGFVDKLAKLIPFEVGMTLDKAFEQEPELPRRYENEEDVRELWDLAKKLEGVTRNAGKHAGGVVIAPSELTDFAPLFSDESGGGVVTQFDKDDVEHAGLVKFDFLGLRTLTIIDWAVATINEKKREQGDEELLDITRIPIDDKAVFKMLQAANTTAVFQLESRGMKELIKRLKPSSFEDIIALVALFRPGPLQSGMVDDFIARKHGRAKVEYPHPDLEPILEPTYGVILYQEQVMQIAQVLAGYTLGAADLLRRAMGKKKAEEMAKQRQIFTEGAVKRGVEESTATYIFDLMEKFAGYGFNKSHSAAYALVSYQTAWLKAHYPAAFMAAVMSSDMDHTEKVVIYVEDANAMKLTIAPPDVNRGRYKFSVDDEGDIIYGIGAIKGVGEGAIESIVRERRAAGPYKDLFDFCNRVDLKKANRRVLESLIRAGALDNLGPNRATLMASLDEAMAAAEQFGRNEELGQEDLFGNAIGSNAESGGRFVKVKPWTDEQVLHGEKETLGLYLTGHPIDRYLPEIGNLPVTRLVDLQPTGRNQAINVVGLIVGVRVLNTKRGGRMAVVTLDDRSARAELTVYSEAFEEFRQQLTKDTVVVAEGDCSEDNFSGGMRVTARNIMTFEEAREKYSKGVQVRLASLALKEDFTEQLQHALRHFTPGVCPVLIEFHEQSAGATVPIRLGVEWQVQPADELLHRLREISGCTGVEILYS